MIPVDLFDRKKTRLDYKIIKFVNDNLKAIVEVFIDYLNENDGIDVSEKLIEVLPRDYILRKPEECRRLVDELYEIICSSVLRDYIKPKYEYVLFHIIYRWKELCDDGLQEISLPVKLSDVLRAEISSCEDYLSEEDDGRIAIIEIIEDLEEYLYICFYDHDFLPETLENFVGIYLRSPEFMETKYPDVDLDEYTDLMSVDLRELYLEKKQAINLLEDEYEKIQDLEYRVITELHSAISILQNHCVEWSSRSEVEISNELYRMLKRVFKLSLKLELEREAQIGRAKVNLGETDFAIYRNDEAYQNIAIIESKLIEKFLNEYGQLLGYLNPSFRFGVTISINKEKSIDLAVLYIENKLRNINDISFKVTDIVKNPFGEEFNYILKSEHTLPEDSSRTMELYHLIINLCDPERKRIAEESRQ